MLTTTESVSLFYLNLPKGVNAHRSLEAHWNLNFYPQIKYIRMWFRTLFSFFFIILSLKSTSFLKAKLNNLYSLYKYTRIYNSRVLKISIKVLHENEYKTFKWDALSKCILLREPHCVGGLQNFSYTCCTTSNELKEYLLQLCTYSFHGNVYPRRSNTIFRALK